MTKLGELLSNPKLVKEYMVAFPISLFPLTFTSSFTLYNNNNNNNRSKRIIYYYLRQLVLDFRITYSTTRLFHIFPKPTIRF